MEPGTLPVVALPSEEVEAGGVKFTIRSLSRGDAIYMQQEFGNQPEKELEAEAFTLSKGLDVTLEVARAWIAVTPSKTVDELNTAILKLSGLVEDPPPN